MIRPSFRTHCGTHVAHRLEWRTGLGAPLAQPYQRRRWGSNPLEPGCSRLPCRLAPASIALRGHHLLAAARHQNAPPRNRTSSGRFVVCHAIRHTRRANVTQYPDLGSNQDLDLRRVRCDPLHHRDVQSELTTGFAPASSGLQDRHLTFRPRRQAGVRGFEPRATALETVCSPRSTPL